MPMQQKRICNYVGCGKATHDRYCDVHMPIMDARHKAYMKQIDLHRGSAASRGYDSRWQKVRSMWLKQNPLCAECEKQGKLTTATVVDHIIPHHGNVELFRDSDNWQSLCKHCHDAKTMREIRSRD